MNRLKYTEALDRLTGYVIKENYKGYDPYDTLNSKLKFSALGKWPAVLATQLQKRNPINIRKLLGIKKEHNPKGMGLFLAAFSLVEKDIDNPRYKKEIDFLSQWLSENYSKGYKGYCWGYNFPWTSPTKFVDSYVPSIVVTSFVGKGFFEYYQQRQDPQVAKILESITEFILHDLHIIEDKTGICFSYTPIMEDICYNASMLGAEILAKVYFINKNSELLDHIKKAVDFVVARQHDDGHWNYSFDKRTGSEREQIDYHQGFILESLYEIMKYSGISEKVYNDSLQKGMRYYRNVQFNEDGSSKWRIPKNWPKDIHHQAQGIITFAKLKELDPDYLKRAVILADWTIDNMQDKSGFFYYRKHRFVMDKISYIRWAQAWMTQALAVLIFSLEKNN